MNDVGKWLADLDLGHYAETFALQCIEFDQINDLDDADLKELGVAALGHRKRLLKAITQLNQGAAAPTAPPGRLPPRTPSSVQVAPTPAAERRQLTVMFCDLVGSTDLSGQYDPEDYRRIIVSYHDAVTQAVAPYEGHVARFLGDGCLVYFGFPHAHEDDAARAVLAALNVLKAVKALRLPGERILQTRIGIATGQVVIGEIGTGTAAAEQTASGETPNLAARLQACAKPGEIVLANETRSLLGTAFDLESIGPLDLKGFAQPVIAWRAIGERALETRLEAQRGQHLTRFVGRENELLHMEERWATTREGRGQAVLISGDGGIGKSRLLATFRERAGIMDAACRNIYCSPFFQNTALHPIIDLIERQIGRASDDSSLNRASALKGALVGAGLTDAMTLALITSLVALDTENELELRRLAPDQRKRRTMDALIAWFNADARVAPLAVIVEDLHWIDASTRDLLGMLLERIAELPILLVLTFRPEFVPAWALHGQVSMLSLGRLTSRQSAMVATSVIGDKELPVAVVDEVVRRTDGVPLFVEELIKAIVDAQNFGAKENASARTANAAPALTVPATLRDSLTSRLDRLGEAKMVAQLASVLGREFEYAMLHAICDLPQADLEKKLAVLNRADIIQQRGVPPHSTYVFKHALIQEAAYDTLLKETRARYHQRAAEAYVSKFPEVAQSRPELVAHHFSRASLPAPVIDFWRRAGEVAVSRSGYSEAIAHLGVALEKLALLPDSPERMRTELDLRVKIGPALIAIKGMGASESCENYERACHIAEKLGDSRNSSWPCGEIGLQKPHPAASSMRRNDPTTWLH